MAGEEGKVGERTGVEGEYRRGGGGSGTEYTTLDRSFTTLYFSLVRLTHTGVMEPQVPGQSRPCYWGILGILIFSEVCCFRNLLPLKYKALGELTADSGDK